MRIFRFKDKKRSRNSYDNPYHSQRSYAYRSSISDTKHVSGKEELPIGRNTPRQISIRKRLLIVAGTLVAVSLVIYLSILENEAKLQIKGDNPPVRNTSLYIDRANDLLKSEITSRSKLTIDKPKIATEMKEDFPEINSVSISTGLFAKKPTIEIEMAKIELVFISNGRKYGVTSDGIASFEQGVGSININTEKYLEVTDQTGVLTAIGSQVLSSEHIDFIQEFAFQTKRANLKIDKILLKPGGEQVDFMFEGLDYSVKTSIQNTARGSAGTFKAMKKRVDKDNIRVSEYIDVRVFNRAYIK